MDLGVIIEVAMGILFVWILLALITSQLQEWVASVFHWRADMLEQTVRNMLSDPGLAEKFYNHPLIQSLHTGKGRKPSYIPDNKFALVLFDVVMDAGSENSLVQSADSTFQKLNQSLTAIQATSPKVAKTLQTLILGIEEHVNHSDYAIGQSRRQVESWFNDTMDRLSGAYRRRAQVWAITLGIALALIMNADSVAILNKLWRDPLVRQTVAAQAEAMTQEQVNQQGADPAKLAQYVNQIQGLSIPLGWGQENIPTNVNDWLVKLGGILISGVAAAQGAPFWFDMLKKLINIRSSGGVATTTTAPAAPAPVEKTSQGVG